jgi:phosphate-selective porin OprO and OprP
MPEGDLRRSPGTSTMEGGGEGDGGWMPRLGGEFLSPAERRQIMFLARHGLLPVVMACAIGVGISTARAADPTNQQLLDKINQLQSKVDSLQAQQDQQNDLTTAVQQVLQESDSQSQLMSSVPNGIGYDPTTGIRFASDDGNFLIHPFALVQFRYVANYRDDITNSSGGGGADAPAHGDDTQSGFEIRRMKLGLDGNIYSPNLKYFVQFNVADAGGAAALDDAYMTYRLSDTSPWTLKAGQFKDIPWHESSIDDSNQLAADVSLVSGLIGGFSGSPHETNQARVQGIDASYDTQLWRAEAAFTDGYNTGNTPFFDNTIIANIKENFGISGRFEYKVLGDDTAWDEYQQLSALGDKSEMLILGGGTDWTQAGSNDIVFYTADAQYDNPSGLSLYGAFLGAWIQNPHGVPGVLAKSQSTNAGFLAQGGYMLNHQWEPFARVDYTSLNGAIATLLYGQQHNVWEMTLGVNYYLYGQRAKVTLDGSYLPNGCPTDADGLGYLTNNGHAELVARLQLQLLI